jgi:hypothetical protein
MPWAKRTAGAGSWANRDASSSAWVQRNSRFYDVRHFGAHIDGATDDATHIQDAIDAIHKAGGGIVFLPRGTYSLQTHHTFYSTSTGYLELRDGVYLLGEGATTILKGTTTLNSIVVAPKGVTGIGVADVALTSTVGAVSNAGDGIKFAMCDNVTVSGVTAYNLYSGMNFVGCTTVAVKNSLSYNHYFAGISSENMGSELSVASANTVTDCEAYGCMRGFWASGQKPGEAFPSRMTGFSWIRCDGHDNSDFGFCSKYASNGTMTDCTAHGNIAGMDVYLNNVAGFTYHNSPTPYLVTAANQPADFASWGSAVCTGVVAV